MSTAKTDFDLVLAFPIVNKKKKISMKQFVTHMLGLRRLKVRSTGKREEFVDEARRVLR